ncbi:MAG: AraC family transcriptional regulator [Flavobacteriaceae bacterium]|nr:AraC family transcriptional regulator [Flavobacteriaceae bacterium]
MRLRYLDKFLFIDSILKVNYQFFEPEHIRKFETPRLLEQKENLIAQLEKENKSSRIRNWWIGGGLSLSLLILGYYINRQLVYKKRFIALLNAENQHNSSAHKNEISSEVVDHILDRLRKFENEKEFLTSELSLQLLAKKIHTNSNYLSRVINLKMGKNFSQYIHDLRIEYSMRELLAQKKYRNYTIKAIAEDCGYTNAESFSRAFYKKNGIYPSYYIKKLNKSTT